MHEKRTISADDGRAATTPGFASARLAALRARRRAEPTEASAPPSEGGRSEGSPEADEAVALWRRGLRPVPLTPIGAASWRPGEGVEESDGKDPIGRDWAARPFASEGEVRAVYGASPGAGVGLALGLSPDGGAGPIDVEVDDPKAAAATLAAIFGPAGPPATAGWASARGEHRVYLMTPADAGRLLAAGIHQATLDGRNHACLAGLEIRLGTLDPGRPKQTQSVVPPTATRGKDGSVSPRRRWIGAGAGFAPMPGALLVYLVGNLGSRPAATAAVRGVPDRDGLEGLTPLEKFAAQIGKLGLGRSACGDGFACRCPAHMGERNNLQFAEGDDGRLLVHCKRGCTLAEVLAAVGLAPAEAYYYPGPRRRSSPRGPRACGLSQPREIAEEQRARLHFADEKAYEALSARPESCASWASSSGSRSSPWGGSASAGARTWSGPTANGSGTGPGRSRGPSVFRPAGRRAEVTGRDRPLSDERLLRGGWPHRHASGPRPLDSGSGCDSMQSRDVVHAGMAAPLPDQSLVAQASQIPRCLQTLRASVREANGSPL